MTDGMKTSEFLLSLAAMIAATVALLAGRIDAGLWASMVGGLAGAYTLSRGMTKWGGTKRENTRARL